MVMFIHREDVYTTEEEWTQTHLGQDYPRNIAEIIIAKHRKGPTGSIRLESSTTWCASTPSDSAINPETGRPPVNHRRLFFC